MAETKPKRRWFRFSLRTLLVLVAFAAVLAWVCLKIRGQVKVAAWLTVRDEFSLSDPQQKRDPAELNAYRDAQVKMLEGPFVRERVVSKLIAKVKPNGFGTRAELQQWIADHLVVSLHSGTDMIEITMPGIDPDQAAEIINEVAQTYLEVLGQEKFEAASRMTSMLASEIDRTSAEINRKSEALTALERQSARIAEDRALLRDKMAAAKRLLTAVQERQVDVDLQLATAKTKLDLAPDNSPEAAKAKVELAVANAQDAVLKRTVESLSDQLNHGKSDVDGLRSPPSELADLAADIKNLQNYKAKLNAEIFDLRVQARSPDRVLILKKAKADGQ